jgi:tryptophanyl-tRNA synthetase
MEIVTDSASVADPKNPSGSAIVALYRLVASGGEVRQMEEEFRAGGVGYSEFKRRLFEALEAYFAPFHSRREALAREPAAINRLLKAGAERARAVAIRTMARVRQAVGID